MSGPYTIADVERLLPQARKVAAKLGIPEDEAPIFLGVISTDPVPPEALKRGRELALEHGWISAADQSRETSK